MTDLEDLDEDQFVVNFIEDTINLDTYAEHVLLTRQFPTSERAWVHG